MTDQELKDIVAAVVAELEKSGVDFDYKADQAKDDDLVFVIRGTAPDYQGVTVTWKGLLDIITAQATQAKNDAETAKNAANTILEQVQSKGTEITNFVATSKAELETQKNESVNAVKSVYQTDLNELKGDLGDLYDANLAIGDMTNGKYIDYDDGKMYNGANYSATGFVPVKSGYSVKLDGVALIDYASVCGYDSKQKFVKPILTSSTGNVEFDVEDGISYIRATGKVNDVVTGKYVNYPISKDFEKANEKIEKNELGNIFKKTIKLTQRSENRYVYYEDATLEYDTNSDSFYKIPVARNKDIVIDGIYVVGNRSVVGHKYDGTYIDIIHNSGKTSLKFNSADCDFVSVTVAKGITPTIEYVDYYTDIKDEFEFDSIINYNESDVKIPYPKTAGYLNENGVIVANNSFRVSEFISVRFGEEITIKNFFAMAYCLCHFYDEDKILIKSIPYDNTYVTVSSATVRVPYNVKYVRYSLSVNQLSTTGIEYAEKTLKNSVTNGFTNRFINKMNTEMAIPFAKATDKPIITIVDDDTTNTRAVEVFYNKLNNLGIVGTYACLTRQFTTDTNLCAKLKEYKRKGFQTVIHGYIQGDFYKTTEDRNISLCMDDLVHGMEDLNANNFLDYKYWVTPFGVNDDSIVKLAKKLGLKCIVNIGSSSINSDDGTFDRYHIQRYGLNEACNVEEVKSLVDKCVSQNGWLVLGTHSAQWSTDFVEFDEIINYALAQGCEIMTLGDALRKREPIYRYYEMF